MEMCIRDSALTALLVLAFLVLCRGKRRPEGFLDAFFCPSPGFMGLMAASGFCFLGAGLLGLLEWMDQFQLFRISRDAYLSACLLYTSKMEVRTPGPLATSMGRMSA